MAQFKLAADLYRTYYDMRLPFGERKFAMVVRDVQRSLDASPAEIADFCDGGNEGWGCGDEEHGAWLQSAPVIEIAGWVEAGLRCAL